MIDKIPIKTLLDHAKQPFIPYTTAKSVMWDGTDKTLYDVVMEGVPIPEIEEEYLPTYRVEDNSRDNPIVWSEQKKGIYFFPDWTLYYKMDENDSVRSTRILDYRVYKMYDYVGPEEGKPHFIYFGDTGIRRFNTHTLYNGGYVSDILIPSSQSTSWVIQGSTMFNYLPTCYQTPTQTAHLTPKKYVDAAITSAIEENNTGLNADIMVAINSAGRAEMRVEQKVDISNIDLTGRTVTLLSLVKELGAAGIHYARWYSTTDGGTSGISDKPTGNTNAGFVCEAFCNRYNSDSDYRYALICWVQNNTQPYVALIDAAATAITWVQLANTTTVATKQNKITYGTGDPSGGSDGDVYLKYTA